MASRTDLTTIVLSCCCDIEDKKKTPRFCFELWNWKLEEEEELVKREKKRVRRKDKRETKKEKGKREKEGEERRNGRRE